MKKYVVGLLLLIAHNVCAMDKEVVNNEKDLSITTLLKKHSRNPNKKRRIGADHLIPMNIHQQCCLDVQRNIFGMMYERYSAKKEIFVAQKIQEFKWFVDRSNKVDWSITVELKNDYESLLKNDLCELLRKAEHHSFCQKNNTDKALEAYGSNYVMNTKRLRSYNRFPMELESVDMTERITAFVKKHYDPIILFWYIVHTKQGSFL